MARPKKYGSDAERQAAFRARRNEKAGFVTNVPVIPSPRNEILVVDPAVCDVSSRAAAIDLGRRLGEHEADRRGEVGLKRAERVMRARQYAAWVFDGRPLGRDYSSEFPFPSLQLAG